ncbi:primosomal protein [Demequina sediminicola]|uniref:primosomal protein n=1 Tax=Demequina sediminicola TaxID=1095026 RepID=UPI00157B91CB|nr:primosomal protein [Demequina sediminicola]
MSVEARDALRRLIAAFETHLEAVASKRDDDDAVVDDAYEGVALAFTSYEMALDTQFAETLPLVVDEEFEDDLDDADTVLDDPGDRELDGHAQTDEEALDDDIEDFDLR